jgi:hypothetical protein
MWNMNDVKTIRFVRDYTYYVEFDDGLSGEVDFTFLLDKGPVFHALKDRSFFASAVIDGGTIAWPNGCDVSPESLYEYLEQHGHACAG